MTDPISDEDLAYLKAAVGDTDPLVTISRWEWDAILARLDASLVMEKHYQRWLKEAKARAVEYAENIGRLGVELSHALNALHAAETEVRRLKHWTHTHFEVQVPDGSTDD
jgi:hypothetical protein